MKPPDAHVAGTVGVLCIVLLLFTLFGRNLCQLKRNTPFIKFTGEWTRRREIVFFVCMFGVNKFRLTSRLRILLESLSQTMPRATFVVGLSPYTDASSLSHHGFELDIRIGRLKSNVRRSSLRGKTADVWSLLRSSFYRDYLSEHPEIEYVFYCDDDVMILRDPMELIENDPDVVHVMADAYPLTKKDDWNYIWLNAWNHVDDNDKERCNIRRLQYSLDDPIIANQIPLNAGLMCGRAKNVLTINTLLSETIACMKPSGKLTDQGLLNMLWLTGQINATGVKVMAHRITGKLVSCSDFLGHADLYVNADKIVAMHHWQNIEKRKLKLLGERVVKLGKQKLR